MITQIKDLLQYIFSDVWYFFATLLLLYVLFEGVAKVIRAIRGKD